MMTLIDYAIIAVIVFSGLIAAMRGFVHESLSLIAWVVAIWFGIRFMLPLEQVLIPYIKIPLVRHLVAFFALFLLILIASTVIIKVIKSMLQKIDLGATDHVLGMVFGCGRGTLIIILLAFLIQITPLTQEPILQESRLLPYFSWSVEQLNERLMLEHAEGSSGLLDRFF